MSMTHAEQVRALVEAARNYAAENDDDNWCQRLKYGICSTRSCLLDEKGKLVVDGTFDNASCSRYRLETALSTIDLPAILAALEGESRAKYVLSGLSSYLGVGIGDDSTTAEQFDTRIRWGIDHIGSVYRNRAASVVEECSKRPTTTWGEVKKAILNDTSLPPALSTPPTESKEP